MTLTASVSFPFLGVQWVQNEVSVAYPGFLFFSSNYHVALSFFCSLNYLVEKYDHLHFMSSIDKVFLKRTVGCLEFNSTLGEEK